MSWLDWTFREPHADIHRFVAQLTGRRVRCDWGAGMPGMTLNELLETAAKTWHGVRIGHPDWSDSSHTLAFSADHAQAKVSIYVILNAYWEALEFELPQAAFGGGRWRRWIDTSVESPYDVVEWDSAELVAGEAYAASPHSLVILFSQGDAVSALSRP